MSRSGRPGGEYMADGHTLVIWVALGGGSGRGPRKLTERRRCTILQQDLKLAHKYKTARRP
eukprot:scaffold14928_cov72-Phaeocystis_antarctica.AAC.3